MSRMSQKASMQAPLIESSVADPTRDTQHRHAKLTI